MNVFFVISGFLITSLILKELYRGQFSLIQFWERRVRRIFPAAIFMTLATLVAGYFLDGLQINRKKVERIMRLKRWKLKARRAGQRPRVQASRSIVQAPNQRWATDIALVHCGTDGWRAMVNVIDCCTREILGWELDRIARAKTTERALEGALLSSRFGWLHGAPPGLALRHDNGLVFGFRLYGSTVRRYGLKHEYIAPYTPEQNGLCERFIRTLKEQCVWLNRFSDLPHARAFIANWIHQYNTIRPQQPLDYLSPTKYLNSLLCQQAA